MLEKLIKILEKAEAVQADYVQPAGSFFSQLLDYLYGIRDAVQELDNMKNDLREIAERLDDIERRIENAKNLIQ